IWPESESFREPPEAKPIPSWWKGKCVGGGDVRCNRKLIGARFYLKGFEEAYGELNRTRDREYRSPRDRLGHGTHTASTAVGSVVSDVSGFAGGVARGGAPSARLAVYKTCWGKDLEGVCTEADILAAFDDAVRDGVDVISASFGSSPPLAAFFESSADIGGFHAAERGVSVVFSGGNDGPDPGLVQNVAPWAVSVAASTMDRSFPTNIVIDGGLITLTGQSLVSQEITGTLALATTYFDGGVCKWENWLKKLATETIILCFSTLGPVQFIEEAQAAAIRANASALQGLISKQTTDSNTTISITIFKQFVHRSFLSNKAPVLAHLHLSLGRDCPSVDIGLWINLALSRHVRVLHIVIPYPKKGPVTLPSSLYTSEKLQRLTLIKCVFLDVPVHVRLPSLKTLSLKLITYADNTSLQRLLSGCPNLEGLSVVVEQCIGDPPVDVNIVMPSLQRLHMSHANIETRGTYVIDVPSLKCLEISDSARCNFRQIENMPELVRARVSFGADSTHKFPKALTSVRRLTLRQPLTKVVNPSGMIFNQLVHLVLYTFSLAIYFSGMDIWKPPSSVPECLLHSLEAFEWFEYKGRQVDREMAKYVLKNALRLKTATFSKRSTDMGEKCQMLKELESVATASPSAQILFD
ncbi:hypothetical protein F2Q70_00033115, partial [Brassica cretica]